MNQTVELQIELGSHVLWARRIAGRVAHEIGFEGQRLIEIDTCVKELAGALAGSAFASRMISFREVNGRGRPGMEIAAEAQTASANQEGMWEAFMRVAVELKDVVDESETCSSPASRRILVRKFLNESRCKGADSGINQLEQGFRASVEVRTYPGAEVSGDGHVVHNGNGKALLALLDGLGHGVQARKASSLAELYLNENHYKPLERLVVEMHDLLKSTRGVVAGLVRIDEQKKELLFTGVGNVSARLWQPDKGRWESMTSTSGALGIVLKNQLLFSYPWREGSILVMHTDGVSPSWELTANERLLEPEDAARLIMKKNCVGSDDATVLVAK